MNMNSILTTCQIYLGLSDPSTGVHQRRGERVAWLVHEEAACVDHLPANKRLTTDQQKDRHHPSSSGHPPASHAIHSLFHIIIFWPTRPFIRQTSHIQAQNPSILPLTLHLSNNQVFSFPCSRPSIVYILDFLLACCNFFRVPFHLFFFSLFLFSFLFSLIRPTPRVFILLLRHCCTTIHAHTRTHAPYRRCTWLTTTHTRSFLFSPLFLLPLWKPLWNQRSFHQLASYLICHTGTHSFIHSLI